MDIEINICKVGQKGSPSGGLEPPTFRLTVERASQLRHEGIVMSWVEIENLVAYVTMYFIHLDCKYISLKYIS